LKRSRNPLFSQFSYNQQPICTILREMTDADEIMHPQFWDRYDRHLDPDKSKYESQITFVSNFAVGVGGGLHSLLQTEHL